MSLSLTERPWLELYGARQKTAPIDSSSVLSAFRACANTSMIAIHYFGSSLSYQWLDERSDELAAWFADELKISRGDRVAIILQNVPEFVIATLAAWKLGAVPMPLNPMYKAGELSLLFADGAPRGVVCHAEHVHTVTSALRKSRIESAAVLTVDANDAQQPASVQSGRDAPLQQSLNAAMNAKRGARAASLELSAIETGLLLYTSGTTGAPKGAVLSQGALSFNSCVSRDWFGIRHSARILAIAPLFHIIGFLGEMCATFASQGTLILSYRFEPGAMIELMRVHRPTFMIGPITAYIAMMNHPSVQEEHFSSFDTLYTGGGPVPLAVVRQFEQRFARRIASAYGMTETCTPTHVVPYERESPVYENGVLSVGIPVSGVDARIERSDGTPANIGEAGELLVRGPMMMDGYLNKPEATAQALKDGWMYTGDMAVMNSQGWFFIIDRKKDMIIASGFKVWPREVEDLLYTHPSVREAAVVGVADFYRGETIRAYVSLRPGTTVTAEELITLCRTHLATYKAPRQIEILAELPKTASGKIMRAELRKAAATQGITNG